MGNDALTGIDFSVAGVVRTESRAYAVLVDDSSSSYFPIQSGLFQTALIEGVMSNELDFDVDSYGLYFTLISMFKAHGIRPTQISFVVKKGGSTSCSLELVEENELGSKVSRIPILLQDAVVVSSLGTIPIVVYGVAGTEFVFKIDKAIPKQNIFSAICEEIVKSERMSAISSGDDNE